MWTAVIIGLIVLVAVVAIIAALVQHRQAIVKRGHAGRRGRFGATGLGTTGPQGATGLGGATGADGTSLNTGAQGATGAALTGPDGPTGPEGFSVAIVQVTGGVIIVDALGHTGLVADGATGPTGAPGPTGAGSLQQLSYAAGPLNTNLAGNFMTFSNPLTAVEQLGTVVMAAPGTAACLYVQLNEAASTTGATGASAGFNFTAYLDGASTPLLVYLAGGETEGHTCGAVPFVDTQSWSVNVAQVNGSFPNDTPHTGAYASASLSYSS